MLNKAVTSVATLALLLVLTGCNTMKPQDFAQAAPTLDLFEYFNGHTKAWGLFEDRFGKVRRQFQVDIKGSVDGDLIVLDEHFTYNDGETDRRVWRIRQIADRLYEGEAGDVVGKATGVSSGNALNWRYDLNLKVGESTYRVHFDDWMFLQPGGVMINRATVSKWGVNIGQVTLFFMKPEAGA